LNTGIFEIKMRHAIAYISSKRNNITDAEIQQLLNQAYEHNNAYDIHGLLLYSEGNFFQLIEGERQKIQNLYYDKIEKDPRHKGVIKFIDKEISLPSFDGYFCDIPPSRFNMDQAKMDSYIDYIRVLEPKVRNPVIKILGSFLPAIHNI